jgi:hypothetical protein
MKNLHIALIYNAYTAGTVELPEDRASMADLKRMIRHMVRTLRKLGHTVTVLPLAYDLFAFQRKLRRIHPDVVFNQYDDVVHGALYEMQLDRGNRTYTVRSVRAVTGNPSSPKITDFFQFRLSIVFLTILGASRPACSTPNASKHQLRIRLRMWRGHSCLPRRDSSRRLSMDLLSKRRASRRVSTRQAEAHATLPAK